MLLLTKITNKIMFKEQKKLEKVWQIATFAVYVLVNSVVYLLVT
jgi:hypothetical protein